jgi:preprotein translocase subunit YajC
MISKSMISAAALALASVAVPAAAQAPAAQAPAAPIAPGTVIKDSAGGEVGTVASVDGQFLVIKTDRNEARIPVTSFTPSNGVLLFGMTRDQLNAEVDKAQAASDAKIVVGAPVTGAGGASVGTIEAVDAEFVTLKLTSGGSVRLPRKAVAGGPTGVVTTVTAAELEATAASAAPSE